MLPVDTFLSMHKVKNLFLYKMTSEFYLIMQIVNLNHYIKSCQCSNPKQLIYIYFNIGLYDWFFICHYLLENIFLLQILLHHSNIADMLKEFIFLILYTEMIIFIISLLVTFMIGLWGSKHQIWDQHTYVYHFCEAFRDIL